MPSNDTAPVKARKRLGLLGRKLGMTQIFLPGGRSVPVTVLQLGPCVVVQRKSAEREGYNAVQVGFESTKASRENKPTLGHAKKADKGTFRFLRADMKDGEEDKRGTDAGQHHGD